MYTKTSLTIVIFPSIYLFLWFFWFKKKYLFIYIWLHWVFIAVHSLSLVVVIRVFSVVVISRASHHSDFPFLQSTGSRARGLSCSVVCGIFLDQGSNPCSLLWQAYSQPLYYQGRPLLIFLSLNFYLEPLAHLLRKVTFDSSAFPRVMLIHCVPSPAITCQLWELPEEILVERLLQPSRMGRVQILSREVWAPCSQGPLQTLVWCPGSI